MMWKVRKQHDFLLVTLALLSRPLITSESSQLFPCAAPSISARGSSIGASGLSRCFFSVSRRSSKPDL